MSWLTALLLIWLMARLLRRLIAWVKRRTGIRNYELEPRQNWALALAHPMAIARVEDGFADVPLPSASESLVRTLRPSLLHLFRLRNDMTEEQIRAALTEQIGMCWFRLGLDDLGRQDDPRAAMAFACARVAFAVRAAAMLRWIDADTQWHILYQNAQRANDCFESWFDYGRAWAHGRRQWVERSRADSLGVGFTEQDVRDWIADRRHPWCRLPWRVPPLFNADQPIG